MKGAVLKLQSFKVGVSPNRKDKRHGNTERVHEINICDATSDELDFLMIYKVNQERICPVPEKLSIA